MKISQIGEFGLIGYIRKKYENGETCPKIVKGIGDDCAVIKYSKSKYKLLTTDILIEGVHFLKRFSSPYDIGYKSLAVNVSDIAAMGGIPEYYLIAIGLPCNTGVPYVNEIYRGLGTVSKKYSLKLIGGDTVKSDKLVISITVIGETSGSKPLMRSGARPGDLIYSTGTLGDSAAGLDVLFKGQKGYGKLVEKHLRPAPKVEDGLLIRTSGRASAMIDSSDGLDISVKQICAESGTGCRIFADNVPVSVQLKKFCSSNLREIYNYALYGGEDYELIFTAPEKHATYFEKKYNCIGVITRKKGIEYINSKGVAVDLQKHGYDHFKK